MPFVGGFSRLSPVSPTQSFRRHSIITSITLIGSQDHDVKSRPNLFAVEFTEAGVSAGGNIGVVFVRHCARTDPLRPSAARPDYPGPEPAISSRRELQRAVNKITHVRWKRRAGLLSIARSSKSQLCSRTCTATRAVVALAARPLTSPPERTGLDSRRRRRDDDAGRRVFLGDLPFLPPLHSDAASFSPRITLTGCQCVDVKGPMYWNRYGGNSARLARRSDEALGVRVIVARIARFLTLDAQLHSPLKSRQNPFDNFTRSPDVTSFYVTSHALLPGAVAVDPSHPPRRRGCILIPRYGKPVNNGQAVGLSRYSVPRMRHGPSPLLEVSMGLATTQECSGETGWRLGPPRRITRWPAVFDGGRLAECARAKISVEDDWRLRDDGERGVRGLNGRERTRTTTATNKLNTVSRVYGGLQSPALSQIKPRNSRSSIHWHSGSEATSDQGSRATTSSDPYTISDPVPTLAGSARRGGNWTARSHCLSDSHVVHGSRGTKPATRMRDERAGGAAKRRRIQLVCPTSHLKSPAIAWRFLFKWVGVAHSQLKNNYRRKIMGILAEGYRGSERRSRPAGPHVVTSPSAILDFEVCAFSSCWWLVHFYASKHLSNFALISVPRPDGVSSNVRFRTANFGGFEMNFISISSPVLSSNSATGFCVDLRSDLGLSWEPRWCNRAFVTGSQCTRLVRQSPFPKKA
ncbi:hypothetical protein PR048_031737 [Dryococelus australis]|uniref:Uncharacterized protein n=1 Tax=Dryococelus australis TaxID=614101 RepID=A0ABQ9G915_9NEOP|nr:hypothetical protein PR048_031737 [Dryococelus australis]